MKLLEAIDRLNNLVELDQKSMTRILDSEVAINGHLAEFTDLEIFYKPGFETNAMTLFAVINAIFGGYKDEGKIKIVRNPKTKQIERFVPYVKGARDAITIKQAIHALNHIRDLDISAVTAISNQSTPVNANIIGVEDIQLYDGDSIRLLGLINYLFGPVPSGKYEGKGQIFVIRDQDGQIQKFVHYSDVDTLEVDEVRV